MDTNLKHTLQSVVDKCKLIFQPVTTNGYAELNEYGYVKTSQLPGFVDDIIEGYYNSIDGKFYTTESYTSEIIPEGGKIYVSLDSNKTYRWSSSSYVVISETIALGETSSTAFAGDKGKANSEAITTLQTSILNKLDKTMNLSDVQNRQIAVDNLLNASSNAEKFVYVNSNGNVDFAEKPAAQIQSDWTQSDNTKLDYIKNKPTAPSTQVQADWNQTTSTESDYIKNKPAIKAGQGENSIIEGYGTQAGGNSSHAEGQLTIASGHYSHAEGYGATASGNYSHVEGDSTKASEAYSHAEGFVTTASGVNSHAEGGNTTASGTRAHAEGQYVTAKNRSQHAFGEYNTLDPSTASSDSRGTYVEIVGNGTTSSARSNARTLDWDGNENIAGMLRIGSSTSTGGALLMLYGAQLKISFNNGGSWRTVNVV